MKQKREKPALGQVIKGWFAQPAADLYFRPAVHLYSGGLAELQGCRAVLALDESGLLVEMGRRRLKLYGDGLELVNLSRRSILVKGTVLKAEFFEGEEEQ